MVLQTMYYIFVLSLYITWTKSFIYCCLLQDDDEEDSEDYWGNIYYDGEDKEKAQE